MKNRAIVGLLLVCCVWGGAPASAAQAAAATCDRECLRGKVTQLLYVLVKHDAPRPVQLPTRDDAIKAALHYPQGLNTRRPSPP